jgi:hypothetical protein
MKAELADGTILEFLDGTDPAVIQATVKNVLGGGGRRRAAAPTHREAEDASMAALNAIEAQPPQTLQEAAKEKFGFKDYAYRGSILPYGEDEQGNKELATPGIVKGLMELALLPGHATTGGKYTAQDVAGLAAIGSPVSVASRAGQSALGAAKTTHRPVAPEVPTAPELRAAAASSYDKAASLGVNYTSNSVKQWADDLVRTLDDGGGAEINPALFAILKKFQSPPRGSNVSLKSFESARKLLNSLAEGQKASVGTNPLGKMQASGTRRAIEQLDDFVASVDPSRVMVRPAPPTGTTALTAPGHNFATADFRSSQGAASEAAQTLKTARGNAAAAFRSDRITGLGESAELRAAAANSGKNIGNTIRQRLASFIDQPRKVSGLTKDEVAAIRQVVEGTATANTLRRVSNMLGGGGGVGQSLMAGVGASIGYSGGPMGAALGAAVPTIAGSATRGMSNRLTKKALYGVDDLIRARSPLYQSRLANPGVAVPSTAPASMARALTAGGAQPRELTPTEQRLQKRIMQGAR